MAGGARPTLLAVVELGGYPNFTALYQRLGFEVTFVASQRKALAHLKQRIPDLIVAEYNFQSDFRDRSSNLETLMGRLQRHPEARVIAFYQAEHREKFERFRDRFPLFDAFPLPVDPAALETALRRVPGAV